MIVTGLSSDSRLIKPGEVFAALAGVEADGAKYVEGAIGNGAIAIVAARDAKLPDRLAVPVVSVIIQAVRWPSWRRGFMRAAGHHGGRHRHKWQNLGCLVRAPDMAVLGLSAASIGTIGIVSPGGTRKLVHTTPDPVEIHAALAELDRAAGQPCGT